MFYIRINKLYWLDGSDNDPQDLCLHGDVEVCIGSERFIESGTVSSLALYLLKSLTDNHIIHEGIQMLPCCGHFLIADENNETVEITGCPYGVDWSVLHDNSTVHVITENGAKAILSIKDYQSIVYEFADKVEAFYKKCSPKDISMLDDFSRNGYIAFWNEWNKRRSNCNT